MTSATSTLPATVVVVALHVDGRYVQIVRAAGETAAGALGFPGGGVEAGEELRDAAAREVREELGIDVVIGDKAGDTPYRGGIVHMFRAEITRDQLDAITPAETEVSAVELLRVEEILADDRALPSSLALAPLL
jgi:8-oxo-dGTP diphosphatase